MPNTGTCQKCFCNGNSNSCDGSTGACIACGNNTFGFNCDVCAPSYYGTAETGQCESKYTL